MTASIVARAVLAVILMVAFYGLALGMAGILLYLPYAEVVYANRLHVKLAAVCLVGAFVILAAIVPRRDRFDPPGPAVTPQRGPALFETLAQVARATGQPMPSEVYIVGDVNAWVAQRGGFLGIGGRCIMGLGLPLLQALTVSELRAVLAHEFGHFHGGDTRLGGIVYQTRAAMSRTVATLAAQGSWLQFPFLAYAKVFLRVTHAVSRQQEYVADRLAATVAGAGALAEGLKKVHGATWGYERYWQDELAPILEAGYLPPVAEGFGHYLSREHGAAVYAASVEHSLKADSHDPYDTHPALGDRLEALRSLPQGAPPEDDGPATALFRDLRELEWPLIGERARAALGKELATIPWEEVVTVHLRAWQAAAAKYADAFPGRTIGDLATRSGSTADAIGGLLARDSDEEIPADARRRAGTWALGAALTSALARAGWSIRSMPGEPVTASDRSNHLDPFAAVAALVSGALDEATWQKQCTTAAIGDIALWPASEQPATSDDAGADAIALPVPLVAQVPFSPPTRTAARPAVVMCWRCRAPLPTSAEAKGKQVRCEKCGQRQARPL